VDNPLGDLMNSKKAIDAVATHFENPWIASNSQATRLTALKGLRDTTVYHFFCHGRHNWQEVLEGGLALYGKPLTLRDVLRVRSSGARLAFLSACETGILDPNIADEVISLPSGFLQAGVAGVVGTLWLVAEPSTALLVEKFYDLWIEGECEPPEALRQAQLWLRDEAPGDWSDPFYWAGFTYTGV
jgi:CHAT domain-containing protein